MMFVYWAVLILVLPLSATLLRLRTAWLWASLVTGFVMIWGILLFVTWDWARGGTGWPFAALLRDSTSPTFLHDTYYVVADLEWLGGLLFPCVVLAALYLIKAHPKRALLDVALFWATVLLFIAASYVPRLYLMNGGMPRRYADYEGTMFWVNLFPKIAGFMMLAVIITAATRPILSWWQGRKR